MPMVITVQAGVAMTATQKGRYSRQHRNDDTPGHQHPATPQSTKPDWIYGTGDDCTNVLVYQTLFCCLYKPGDLLIYLKEEVVL